MEYVVHSIKLTKQITLYNKIYNVGDVVEIKCFDSLYASNYLTFTEGDRDFLLEYICHHEDAIPEAIYYDWCSLSINDEVDLTFTRRNMDIVKLNNISGVYLGFETI